MKGSHRSRKGTHCLRKRCPVCRKLRKFREPDSSTIGEDHPRRIPWVLTPFGWCCSLCVIREAGIDIPLGVYANREDEIVLLAGADGLCPRPTVDTSDYTYWVRSNVSGFEGLCDQMPSLSCYGRTRDEAMLNIRAKAQMVVDALHESCLKFSRQSK